MNKFPVFVFGLLNSLVLTGAVVRADIMSPTPVPPTRPPVKLGVDVLFDRQPQILRGHRIGLITNPTGLDGQLNSIIPRFQNFPDARLVALYGPEHGVRGNAQAGEFVPYYFDEHYQLPVFSLYGQTHRPPPDMLTNIDQYMRNFDTRHEGKQVESNMLGGVDLMVYDLQDVGTRVYTYVATMAYAMEAAGQAHIPFVVLDRPNPVNGQIMEGPILEYPQHSSFIGLYPVPLRHGMTVGELAQLFNARFLKHPCQLTVVPMDHWTRDEWYDQTGLRWTLPSPNLPTEDSATVYPGQVMLEGTNLSEGRGTTKPFEFFGAPWIDGFVLAARLNAQALPGVRFREVYFTPTFSKFAGTNCGGCEMWVSDRQQFRPVATTLTILATVKSLYGNRLEFHAEYFDKVMGTSTVRLALERGETGGQIADRFNKELAAFDRLRRPYLLYP